MTASVIRLFGMLYRPRQTVRELLEERRGHGVALVLAAGFGALQAVTRLTTADAGPPVLLLGGSAAVGAGALFLFGWLLRNFGRWFGGEATLVEARTALGLGLFPWVLVFGTFAAALTASGDGEQWQAYFPVFFAGFLYGFMVLLLSVSAALRLGVLKAFLCLTVTFLVSLFPLTLVARLLFGTG